MVFFLLQGTVLWLLILLVKNVHSYSSGAPIFVCSSMVPGHGVGAQNSEAPYTISPAQETELKLLGADGVLAVPSKVRLILTSPNQEEFTGFLIQGRPSTSENNTIGSFISFPEDAKTLDCGNTKVSNIMYGTSYS